MIPAILAAPVVEGVVGGIVGSVANLFSPSAPPAASGAGFNPYLDTATAAMVSPSAPATRAGTMRAADWSQMSPVDQKAWLTSLAGKHVDATDESGRTISGVVGGLQQLGNTLAVNIGGHLLSLSTPTSHLVAFGGVTQKIMSNIISPISPTSPAGIATAAAGKSGQSLTQADFLKIMIAQFTQQDPLSSGDSGSGGSGTSDYVSQLISMTNLTTLQTMSGQQAQQLAQSLPGATVEVSDNGVASSGIVQSARVDGSTGGVFFTVGGTEYPSSDLYSINQPAVTSTSPSTSGH